MEKDYAFVPAYYEWHLIDTNEPEKVLLNWKDPIEDLFEESHPVKTYDDVWGVCNHFVEATRVTLFEEEFDDPHGNTKEMFNDLPEDSVFIPIMAHALYDYYIAPFV